MGEYLLLIAIAVLVLGYKRIPELGGAVFSAFTSFKKGLNEDDDERPQKDVKAIEDSKK